MARKVIHYHNIFKKSDYKYNHVLLDLFISQLLKKGKKSIAKSIIYKTLFLILKKTNINPILVLEKTISNIRIKYIIKEITIDDVKIETIHYLTFLESIKMAISWLIFFAKKDLKNKFYISLVKEILTSFYGKGNCIKKKKEIYKNIKILKFNLNNKLIN